jgi:hypothetical protein
MPGDIRALLLIVLGAVGLALGGLTLGRAVASGRARLRGGRVVTRERNPGLFYGNLVALGAFLIASLFAILAGAALIGGHGRL